MADPIQTTPAVNGNAPYDYRTLQSNLYPRQQAEIDADIALKKQELLNKQGDLAARQEDIRRSQMGGSHKPPGYVSPSSSTASAPNGLDLNGNPKAAPDSIRTPRLGGIPAGTPTPAAPTAPAAIANMPATPEPAAQPPVRNNLALSNPVAPAPMSLPVTPAIPLPPTSPMSARTAPAAPIMANVPPGPTAIPRRQLPPRKTTTSALVRPRNPLFAA